MADENGSKERPVRRGFGGPAAILAVVAVGCLLLFWSGLDLSIGEETPEQELASVTFIVGGMMKSRSGAT